jgi:hypothetical protein
MLIAHELCRPSPESIAGTLDTAKRKALTSLPYRDMVAMDGELAGIRFSFDFDDPTLADDLFLMFGGSAARQGLARPESDVTASIRTEGGSDGWGVIALGGRLGPPVDGREFRFAISLPDAPFEAAQAGDWMLISFRGEDEPLIALDGEVCLFRADRDWRKAVIIYLFCRLLRVREDVIFLHAGSIAINGRGILLIGPKGAGKSTTTMALAARGHRFLGDECGAYVPSSHSLLPFRRPVGIKPGPRARAIETALPDARRVVRGEGFVRVALEELLEIDAADEAVPLDTVVFLRGFREGEPRLEQIVPGRDEVAALQPIAGSFINAAGTQRVFQLVALLAHAHVFALNPADPDRTAQFLEEAFSS